MILPPVSFAPAIQSNRRSGESHGEAIFLQNRASGTRVLTHLTGDNDGIFFML